MCVCEKKMKKGKSNIDPVGANKAKARLKSFPSEDPVKVPSPGPSCCEKEMAKIRREELDASQSGSPTSLLLVWTFQGRQGC